MVMANSLQAALNRIKKDSEEKLETKIDKNLENPKKIQKVSKRPAAKTREGTVLIGAHVSPIIQKQLRILAAEEGKKQHSLLLEALELLFQKYGKSKF